MVDKPRRASAGEGGGTAPVGLPVRRDTEDEPERVPPEPDQHEDGGVQSIPDRVLDPVALPSRRVSWVNCRTYSLPRRPAIGAATRVDTNDSRLLRAMYQYTGSVQPLWTTHTTKLSWQGELAAGSGCNGTRSTWSRPARALYTGGRWGDYFGHGRGGADAAGLALRGVRRRPGHLGHLGKVLRRMP
jgi:hypothetical protein